MSIDFLGGGWGTEKKDRGNKTLQSVFFVENVNIACEGPKVVVFRVFRVFRGFRGCLGCLGLMTFWKVKKGDQGGGPKKAKI